MRWKSLGPLAAIAVLLAWDMAFDGLERIVRRTPSSAATVPAEGAVQRPAPVWVTDLDAGGAPLAVEPVPSAPFEGQRKPPCVPRLQREVNGGCWVELAAKPPCPEGAYQSGTMCLLPVLAAKKVPVSGSATPW